MVYFDTNVLIYAFARNIDDKSQQDISIKLLKDAIKTDSLMVSNISLCEFAYVSKRLEEDNYIISENLDFLSEYLFESNYNITKRVLEIFKNKNLYKSSFDVYHFAFAEYFDAKFYTFDKGFTKLKDIAKNEIVIL